MKIPRFVSLVVFCLLTSLLQAQVPVASWEGEMTDWVDKSEGKFTYSYSTTQGVTEGTKSLACTATKAPGWTNLISSELASLRTALTQADGIKIDVTTALTSGATTANITIAFNGNAGGWTQLDSKDVVINGSTTVSWTLTSGQLSMVTNSTQWFQFWIIVQTDGDTGSVYYLDNLRFTKAGSPPAISVQPTATSVVNGATASLSVTATGATPMTYQWFVDGHAIQGVNSATLSIPCAQFTDAGTYSCRISNGAGVVTSDSVALTVTPATTFLDATVNVNAASKVRTVDDRVFGVNIVSWDSAFTGSETLQILKETDTRVLRFPGGSWADAYHWNGNNDLVSPVFNFDQFAETAVASGAKVYITANYGSGTAQEAADWVTYSNVTKKYGFKYWEIGNENYGSWEQDNHTAKWDPVTYANEVKNYMTAMKAADPTIKVGVVVQTGEDYLDAKSPVTYVTNPRTGVQHKGWTPVVLATLKTLGVIPDFVIYHRYEQTPGLESDAVLLQKAKTWPNDAAELRRMLTDYLGTGSENVSLEVTENNSVYGDPGKQMTSLVNGLYMADSTGNILQTEFNAMLWWDLRNGQDTTKNNSSSLYGWRQYGDYGLVSGTNEKYPNFYVAKLLSQFARHGDSVVSASSTSTLLATFASLRVDGTLALLVINKSPSSVARVAFNIAGFSPAPDAPVYTYGPAEDRAAQINFGHRDVSLSGLTNAAAAFTAKFQPYSVSVIRLYPNSGSSRLSNISVRAIAGKDADTLIAGFVAGGTGTSGTLPVLVRGDGPSLGLFGVPGTLDDPYLTLHRTVGAVDSIEASNDNWGGDTVLKNLMAQVGAYGLDDASLDAALSANVNRSDNYTSQITSTTGASGVALAEVYDATTAPTSTTPRLINVSARANVGASPNYIIAGFVVSGTKPKTVVIRGVGPTLDFFGLHTYLQNPKLELHSTIRGIDMTLASNYAWLGNSDLKSLFAKVGAFGYLTDDTKDTAIMATLPPGNYTALLSGVGETSGVALLEVYEVE